MKNIINYIKHYGKFTFLEEPFNDADNLVFAGLSYVDFKPEQMLDNLTIKEVADTYFATHNKKQISKNITAVRSAIKILDNIKDTIRYKDLLVSNYYYITSDETQFCAMNIKIDNQTSYISFEGTDHLISGWKEDFEMAYKFPVKAQALAIKYVNKVIKISSKNFIIGGHSKGGNLALVSSMYCHFWKRRKIIKIYNNDGPGLRKAQIESKKYQNVCDRLIHIIPNYSFVGLLLRHGNNYKVVYSYENGLLAHDLINWKIEGTELVPAKLSFLSKELDSGIIKWLDKYNDIERQKFVESLFDICAKAGIDNLLEYKDDLFHNTIKIIKAAKTIDQETKIMIIDVFKFLIKYCSNDVKNKFFPNSKKNYK